MRANQVSKTAMGTAFMRAYHAAHDHPKIFDDFLAHHMITEEEYQEAEERHLMAFQKFDPDRAATYSDRRLALASWMQNAGAPAIVLGRARYAEDLLEKAVDEGVRQYVNLGAGMDTFAVRRPDLLEKLGVFEVDHPATQAHKRQRLLRVSQEPPAQLHFIALDFSRENLAAALRRSAYDPRVPSFFSWLGVTYYLTRETLFATFSAIAHIAPAGSTIIFDYLDTEALMPERAARRVNIMVEIVERVGEPMLTGFDPAKLAEDLDRVGLRLHEDLGPADIQGRFFADRPDGYHACEHAHFARAVVA
ncbi:MAG: class I SAM-dependent methyltransferase [Desulfobaccales bacterium]